MTRSTSCAASCATLADIDADPPSVLARVVAAPLWAHALVLGLLLVAVMPLVGTHSQFSADEGAAIAQAQLLSNGDGWTMTHPFPAADPSGDAFPIELSPRRGDQYAPFVKHPLYALLLAGADKVGGRNAMVLLSVLGTWCAAVLAALVTRRLDPRRSLAVLALWLTGVVSPLLFDGYVLIAHTVGAACVALAALAFVRLVDGNDVQRASRVIAVAVLAAAVFVAVLLRTEALLLGVGLSAGGLVVARRRRDLTLAVLAVVPLVTAGVARVFETRWASSIMGGSSSDTTPLGSATRGGVGGRIQGFIITFVLPSYRADVAAVLTLAVAALVIAAGVVIVRKPEDRHGPIVFLGAATAMGVARLFVGADPVPGLLVVFPLVLLAAIVVPRRALAADDRVVGLVAGAAVFAVLVLATQFSSGGSGEWGGRYFAIGLPLVIPVVAVALSRLRERLDPPDLRRVGALLACAVLPFSVLAVLTLRSYHETGDRLVAAIVATAARTPAGDGGKPVVISTEGATARFAVDHLGDGRWLTLKIENIAPYADRLQQLSVRSFTLVTHHHDDLDRVPGFRATNVSEPVGGWYVATLTVR